MVKKTDWEAVKKETQNIESILGEWCVRGELPYLRMWAYDFADIRAGDLGFPIGSKNYINLHLVTRNEIMWQIFLGLSDFLDKHNGDYSAINIPLVTYEDMGRIIESIRKDSSSTISTPKSSSSNIEKVRVLKSEKSSTRDCSVERAYCEERDLTRQIECGLSEFISEEDLNSLRLRSFDYADSKAKSYRFLKKSDKYKYLQAVVRHELMSEAEEYILGFSCDNMEDYSKVVEGLLKHNDLDIFFKQFD